MKIKIKEMEIKLYSDVLKSPPSKKERPDGKKNPPDEKKEEENEAKSVLYEARKRIGLKPITLDDLERVAEAKKVKGTECIKFAAIEFLMEELKMEESEINDLGKFNATRKDTKATIRYISHLKKKSHVSTFLKKQHYVGIQM